MVDLKVHSLSIDYICTENIHVISLLTLSQNFALDVRWGMRNDIDVVSLLNSQSVSQLIILLNVKNVSYI